MSIRWVKDKHGIWRCPDPRPPDQLDHADNAVQDVLDRLARNLAKPCTPPALGVVCSDCGCLIRPDERCPACLLWAELEAARLSWNAATDHYTPAKSEIAA